MLKLWEGHLSGTFVGHTPGRIHALPDGSFWIQVCRTVARGQHLSPRASLHQAKVDGKMYLEVDGVARRVQVERVE
jgi:hypothetical protein